MMKFFRKHQKMILLFMAILMVLFLVPSLTYRTGGGIGNKRFGTYSIEGKSQEVTYDQVADSYAELELLRLLGPSVHYATAPYVRNAFDKERGASAWYLWNKLAERYNVKATEADRAQFVKDHNLSDETLNKVRDSAKTTIDEVYKAIDHLIALEKITDLARSQADKVPDYVIERTVRNVTETAYVNLVDPDLDLFRKLVDPNVKVEELGKLFEKYKETPRGANGVPIGYRIPDKVQVDVLTIDAANTVTDTRATEYYKAHPSEYMEKVPATQPAAQSSTQPAARSTTRPATASATQPAAAARAATQPEMRLRPLDAKLMRSIKTQLAYAPTTQGEKSPAEQVVEALSAEAKRIAAGNVSYPDASKEIEKERKFTTDAIRTSWFSQASIAELLKKRDEEMQKKEEKGGEEPAEPPFGQDPMTDIAKLLATSRIVGRQNSPSAELLAFNSEALRGAGKGIPALKLNAQPDLAFQVGNSTRFFIFRVSGAEQSRVPARMEDVMTELKADALRLRAADQAELRLKDVAALIKDKDVSLTAAVSQVNKQLTRELSARAPATQPAAKPTSQPASQPEDAFLRVHYRIGVHRQTVAPNEQKAQLYQQFRGLDRQRAAILSMEFVAVPPPEFPSTKIIQTAFDLVSQWQSPVRIVPERNPQIVTDPDKGVLVLLLLADLVPPSDEMTDFYAKNVRTVLGLQREEHFMESWYEINDRLKFKRDEKN